MKMPNLEKSLKALKVKPRLAFRIKLALKIRFRMFVMNFSLKPWKMAISFSTLTIFIAGFFGFNYYTYLNSYAYYVDNAENTLAQLSSIIENKDKNNLVFIPVAYAENATNEKAKLLIGNTVFFTEKALEKINEISNISKAKKGLKAINDLQKAEIEVFGKGVEATIYAPLLNEFSNALDVTFSNAVAVQKAYTDAENLTKIGSKKIVLNIKPKVLVSEVDAINELDNLKIKKTEAEIALKKIITVSKSNEETAKLSDRYLKALEFLEQNKYHKAYALLSSIQAESNYVSGDIGSLDNKNPTFVAYKGNDTFETQDKPINLVAPAPSKIIEEKPNFKKPLKEINETVSPDSNEETSNTKKKEKIAFTKNETVEFVKDFIQTSEKNATSSSENSYDSLPSNDSEPALNFQPATINDIKYDWDNETKKETILNSDNLYLEDKKILWKKTEEQIELENLSKQIEEEKNKLEQEQLMKEQEQKLIEEEKKRQEEERARLEEERKNQVAQELKRLEEEQLRKAQESKLIEEQKKQEEETRILEEQKRQLEEEQKILEQQRLIKLQEEEATRTLLQQQQEEAKRQAEEALKREQEEKQRIEEQKRILEENQRLIDEQNRLKQAEIQKSLQEALEKNKAIQSGSTGLASPKPKVVVPKITPKITPQTNVRR